MLRSPGGLEARLDRAGSSGAGAVRPRFGRAGAGRSGPRARPPLARVRARRLLHHQAWRACRGDSEGWHPGMALPRPDRAPARPARPADRSPRAVRARLGACARLRLAARRRRLRSAANAAPRLYRARPGSPRAEVADRDRAMVLPAHRPRNRSFERAGRRAAPDPRPALRTPGDRERGGGAHLGSPRSREAATEPRTPAGPGPGLDRGPSRAGKGPRPPPASLLLDRRGDPAAPPGAGRRGKPGERSACAGRWPGPPGQDDVRGVPRRRDRLAEGRGLLRPLQRPRGSSPLAPGSDGPWAAGGGDGRGRDPRGAARLGCGPARSTRRRRHSWTGHGEPRAGARTAAADGLARAGALGELLARRDDRPILRPLRVRTGARDAVSVGRG